MEDKTEKVIDDPLGSRRQGKLDRRNAEEKRAAFTIGRKGSWSETLSLLRSVQRRAVEGSQSGCSQPVSTSWKLTTL